MAGPSVKEELNELLGIRSLHYHHAYPVQLTRATAATANERICRRLTGLEPDTLCARYKFASSMAQCRGFEGDGALPLIMDVVLVVEDEEKATLGGVR